MDSLFEYQTEVGNPSLYELFKALALVAPQSLAIVFDGKKHSYSHLLDRANRLANLLVAHGIE